MVRVLPAFLVSQGVEMPNDSDEHDYIDAQDFETIEDLRKVKERREKETSKSGFLPFFFEDYTGF
ncbi:MAG: hypothetical protein RIR47_39 [Bacteroidota bacterium]